MKVANIFVGIAVLFSGVSASAVAINFPRPEQTIQVKAKDLLVKEEKSFRCVLEGLPESKWSFQNSMEVNVTAVSLQDAAELAITPYVVVVPGKNSEVVQIKVDGQNFYVQQINCKLITKSI